MALSRTIEATGMGHESTHGVNLPRGNDKKEDLNVLQLQCTMIGAKFDPLVFVAE